MNRTRQQPGLRTINRQRYLREQARQERARQDRNREAMRRLVASVRPEVRS